jgi:hypothetical protein
MCAAGQVMTKFKVQAEGNYFTATQASCGTMTYAAGATAPTVTGEVQLSADGGRNTGNGGTLSCPAGYVPTGMRSGKTGSPITKQGIAMTCSRIDLVYTAASFSSVLDQLSVSPLVEANGSTSTVDEAVCPSGQFVAGLNYMNDLSDGHYVLGRLGVRCASFVGPRSSLTRSAATDGAWLGATPGAYNDVDCASTSFVSGLKLRDYGSDFDSLFKVTCAPLIAPSVNGGAVGTGTAVDVIVGGSFASGLVTACPSGTFAYGVRGHLISGSSSPGGLELFCAEAHFFE